MKFEWKEIFYISNILSFLRIFLLIPFYLALTGNLKGWAIILIVVIAATDFLDGYLSRRLRQQTDLGKIIDPIADKLTVAMVAWVLVDLRELPIFYLVAVFGRDLIIIILAWIVILKNKLVVMSNWCGKVAVVSIALVLVLFLFDIDVVKWQFMWVSLLVMFVSLVNYFIVFLRIISKNNSTDGE